VRVSTRTLLLRTKAEAILLPKVRVMAGAEESESLAASVVEAAN
jgi:hypothetical protein